MMQLQFLILQLFLLASCAGTDTQNTDLNKQADVTKVVVSGSENRYSFSVTISSPDSGCEQYADWWEVVSESGELLYRRILLHSHVNEQPFTRSGGTVNIAEERTVWVRAHMNNTGYGGQVMRGSVKEGFQKANLPEGWAEDLDQIEPLPGGCNF